MGSLAGLYAWKEALLEGVRGDRAGTGEDEEEARGGEGEPQSDSRTQIPESKLLLDWFLLVELVGMLRCPAVSSPHSVSCGGSDPPPQIQWAAPALTSNTDF